MTTQIKSPFLVKQYLVPAEKCAEIAKAVRVQPLVDQEGNVEATERFYPSIAEDLMAVFKPLIPEIEAYFKVSYRGTEPPVFQQFPPTGKIAEPPHCENAVFKRKKWFRVKDRDLTAILWLKDYQDTPPFDLDRHVLGGKLEFPVYNFGLQPQAGTLVVYPANERFISATTQILVGELQCVRFHLACGSESDPHGFWMYDPDNFPGDFRTWFHDVV